MLRISVFTAAMTKALIFEFLTFVIKCYCYILESNVCMLVKTNQMVMVLLRYLCLSCFKSSFLLQICGEHRSSLNSVRHAESANFCLEYSDIDIELNTTIMRVSLVLLKTYLAQKRLNEDIKSLFFSSFHHIRPNIVDFGFENDLIQWQ